MKRSNGILIPFFVINVLLSAFSLFVAGSQYSMMATHFGSMSAYAIEQGLHVIVVLVLSVCSYLVTRIKYLWLALTLSILLSPILLVDLAFIVSIR